jgi:glycine/D-amino acid oxidase-like deaminating enzyme
MGGNSGGALDVVARELQTRMQALRDAIDQQGMETNRQIQRSLANLTQDIRDVTKGLYDDLSAEGFAHAREMMSRISQAPAAIETNTGRIEDAHEELQRVHETAARYNEQQQRHAEDIKAASLASDLQGRVEASGQLVSANVQEALVQLAQATQLSTQQVEHALAIVQHGEFSPEDQRTQAVLSAIEQLGSMTYSGLGVLARGTSENFAEVLARQQDQTWRLNRGFYQTQAGTDALAGQLASVGTEVQRTRGSVIGAAEGLVDVLVDRTTAVEDLARQGGQAISDQIQAGFRFAGGGNAPMRPPQQPQPGEGGLQGQYPQLMPQFRAVPAFELAILRAIFHSKGPKA